MRATAAGGYLAASAALLFARNRDWPAAVKALDAALAVR